jgi:hypothetical protein
MTAPAQASQVYYLPSLADQPFLRKAAEALEQLETESEAHGHQLLASLIAIARGEAEDSIKTRVKTQRVLRPKEDPNDGAEEIAQRFAHRTVTQ